MNKREYDKRYYEKNLERIKEKQRKKYINNRERYLKYQKEYRGKNIEKVKEYREKYYKENLEKIKEYNKEYRGKNPEKVKKGKRKEYIKNREKYLKHSKEYRKTHKEEVRQWGKEWRRENSERIKKYRETHSEEIRIHKKEYSARYNKTKKGKIAQAKRKMRYRELKFNPLNELFENSVWHHINDVDVVAIPEEVHLKTKYPNREIHRKLVLEYYGSIENMINGRLGCGVLALGRLRTCPFVPKTKWTSWS